MFGGVSSTELFRWEEGENSTMADSSEVVFKPGYVVEEVEEGCGLNLLNK